MSAPEGSWKVLGWDAAGKVAAVGDGVTDFKVGDAVFYAGSLVRQGANVEYHLVDERIVGRKPATVSDVEAAALPLTAITAWEMMFDRLDVRRAVPAAANAILIIGGAGGVGSITIQLARAYGLDRDRHRIAARDRRMGQRARRTTCDRPQETIG